ncbi:hypothetical protein ACCD10_20175 [Pseudomonas sp. Pseusp122]|uniref:hypothetical protein n=1 Tax=unclassified Pseudomonas TaxID=196821 RepID=UPI0039A75261
MAALRSAARYVRKGLGAAWSLIWMFTATFGLAIALTLLVKGVFGDFDQYKAWQASHFIYLLLWRLLIYGALAWGWFKIRRRIAREAESNKLIRCEVLLVFLACVFEANHAGLL